MTLENSELILELRNVSKVFDHDLFKKKEVAVRDLSFGLERDKCTGLLGHNGAGKTTAIKMILGLIRPTSGQILFDGKAFKRDVLKNIGYMPEVNKLSPFLTPYETLDYQMHLFHFCPEGSRKRYIMERLENVGLASHSKKRNKSLSKGMAQRLAFAYATLHNPRLLILDEPFSGLDPIGRDFMMSRIENLRSLGTSILMCSHEVEAVKRLCDNVLILREGSKVFDSVKKESVSKSKGLSGVQQYQLTLSGIAKADVENLARERELPDYEQCDNRGFLHTLLFFDFEKANLWLRAAVEAGIVVIDFKEIGQSFGENEDLLQYLRRENIQ